MVCVLKGSRIGTALEQAQAQSQQAMFVKLPADRLNYNTAGLAPVISGIVVRLLKAVLYMNNR